MAKIGSIQRNDKRKKLAKSLSNKRKALQSTIMKKDLPLEERFDLVIKLAKYILGD